MAAHSSVLAREILWTKEPGRPTVHGVARVGHHLATKPPTTIAQTLFCPLFSSEVSSY